MSSIPYSVQGCTKGDEKNMKTDQEIRMKIALIEEYMKIAEAANPENIAQILFRKRTEMYALMWVLEN